MTDREMVVLAAEKVMGWTIQPRLAGAVYGISPQGGRYMLEWDRAGFPGRYAPRFSPLETDSDAWMLVDALQAREPGWRFSITGGDQQGGRETWWHAKFFGHINPAENYGQRHGEGRTHDRRRAIALACLRAVGVSA